MRNPAEADYNTKFAREDEFVRPITREGSVKWKKSEICNHTSFKYELHYYFLK